MLPCTPHAVLKIIDEHGIEISGMKTVVIGRSSLVGLPLMHLLINRSATVTLCHKMTEDINKYT